MDFYRIAGIRYIRLSFLITVCIYPFGVWGKYAYHQARGTSELLWCLVVKCAEGEVVALCTHSSPDSTKCVPCDPDAFYMNQISRSIDWRQCYHKRVCTLKNGMSTWKDNDNTKNRQCICDTQYGYYAKHFDPNDPDYTADECFYCPEGNSYVDPIKGCTECHGRIYTDNHRYKHCSLNNTTPEADANMGVTAVGESDLDSGQKENPSGSGAWHLYWALPLIVGVVILATTCLFFVVRKRYSTRALQLKIAGDEASTNHNGHDDISAAPRRAHRQTSEDIEAAIVQTTTPLLEPHTNSYNFVSDPPRHLRFHSEAAVRTNRLNTSEVPADNDGRGDIYRIENFFAGNHVTQVNGNQNGMVANGNIENSPVNSCAGNGITSRSPSAYPPEEHDDRYDSVDSVYTVHENSNVHHPVEEVGDEVPPDHNTPSGTSTGNRNLKRA